MITFGTFIDRVLPETGEYFYVYFKVHAHVYPGQEAIISGPPERCQPGTGPEVEFDRFEVEEFECGLDIPLNEKDVPIIKWEYTPDEFELLAKLHPETATQLSWDRLEEQAIEAMHQQIDAWYEDEAEARYRQMRDEKW